MENKIKAGWYDEQQMDLGPMDYVSYNKIKYMLKSPKAFRWQYTHKNSEEKKDYLNYGHLVHTAMLEGSKFRENYRVMPEFKGLTQEGKESAQSAEAKAKRKRWLSELPPGSLVVTEEERDAIIESVENVLELDAAKRLLTGGRAEKWGYVFDPFFGRWMLIRADFLSNELIVTEVKTTSKPIYDARSWMREAHRMEYDVQLAHNTRSVGLLHGIQDHRKAAWIVIHSFPPYEAFVFPASEDCITKGLDKCFRAYHLINDHLEKDPTMESRAMWPGRQREAEECRPEPWMMQNDEDHKETNQQEQP